MKKPELRSTYRPAAHQYVPQALYQPEQSVVTPAKKSNLRWIVITIVSILTIVGLSAIAPIYFERQKAAYVAQSLPPVEVRHEVVGDAKNIPIPKVETLITPAMKSELNEGKGLEISLISTYNGIDDAPDKVIIEPWKTLEETTPSQRQTTVSEKIAELKAKLEQMAEHPAINWNFVVILDDTDGIDKKLTDKFQDMFNDLRINDLVKRGDGAIIHFAKLTDTDYGKESPTVTIPKGTSDAGSFQGEIKNALQTFLQPKLGSDTSSVYPGLLNILANFTGQNHTRVLILSDMMENDPNPDTGSGVTFLSPEGKKKLMDDNLWLDIDTQLLANRKPVKLKGLTIKIYAPPSVVKNAKVTKRAQDYSEHFLTKLGATVETKWGAN